MSIQVPLDRIKDNPWQTRQSYDAEYIEALAENILENGILQKPTGRIVDGIGRHKPPKAGSPIDDFVLDTQSEFDRVFREKGGLSVQVAFGHNRRRALDLITEWVKTGYVKEEELPPGLLAGCLPVNLRPIGDEEMARHAWTENAQRKELTPLEEALAIRRRMDDFDWTQAEVAEQLGIGRSTVANKLRLLKLPERILQRVAEGELSERQALAVLPMTGLEPWQQELADEHAEKDRRGDSIMHLDGLIEHALKYGWSSDRIRSAVQSALKSFEMIRDAREQKRGRSGHDPEKTDSAEISAQRSRANAPETEAADDRDHAAETDHKTIVLVACSKSKLSTPAMAAGLYTGALFKKCRAYAKKLVSDGKADAWYILSAKHGLVGPREMIDPYDATLSDMDDNERHQWAKSVSNGLVGEGCGPSCERTLVILGGRDYWEPIVRFYAPFEEQAPDIVTPFRGMAGNGEMMQWLERQCNGAADPSGDGAADAAELSAAAETSMPAEVATDWPEPQLDPVWEELPHMTKAELEETHRTFRHEQWGRYSDNFRTSALKEEQFDHVRAQVRFHANLEAVHRLTGEQAARLLGWMREKTGDKFYYSGDNPEAMRPAHTILRSIREVEELGTMAEDAFRRFRLREARRAGAFCYHVFYAEISAEELAEEAHAREPAAVV